MLPPSVYTAPLRTCPFDEDQLAAFERDYHGPRTLAPLRTCPFDRPVLADYLSHLQAAFRQTRGAVVHPRVVSEWA
jgi:hypothetical protein